MKKIAAGCDHAGFELKLKLVQHLKNLGYEVADLGTHSDESVDYPDFGKAVAEAVTKGDSDFGLCICGSGIGMCIAANKVAEARAAVVYDETTAHLARAHNDANIICLGARLIDAESACQCLETFLQTSFEGGRHERRVQKLG